MSRQFVSFPVVVASIDHLVLGATSQIAAWTGRRPSIVIGAKLDAAAVRVEQHLLGIEAGAAIWAPRALNAIGVTLPDRDPLHMDMPVVGGAVKARGEGDHLRGRIVCACEEQQFDPAGEACPDREVDAVTVGCGPQLTAVTGGDAHILPTQNEECSPY